MTARENRTVNILEFHGEEVVRDPLCITETWEASDRRAVASREPSPTVCSNSSVRLPGKACASSGCLADEVYDDANAKPVQE